VENLFARSVFFVKDTERSLRFYTNTLGFKLDWNHQEQGRACVFQVSLFGFQLILNQTEAEARTENRPGHGRVFIGLEHDQVGAFRRHFSERRVKIAVQHWGRPTLVIRDLDENELFIWVPGGDWASLEAELAGATKDDDGSFPIRTT
jgi:catechol 2,3-dioxygenase-like lactoylglutathione lyase family enzyme